MPLFAHTIRPPRLPFAGTLTPEEYAIIERHFAYLSGDYTETKLKFAGRCSDATFGLVMFEAADLASAEAFCSADPVVAEGLMTSELHEFQIAIGE